MAKQQRRYQQKLEDGSSGIRVCESTKQDIKQALNQGLLGNVIKLAEELNWMARCYLHDKIGARNNFNGYVKYSWNVLRSQEVFYTK